MYKATAGFLFDEKLKKVVLIRKERPEWMRGLWNAVGGKIEEGESSLECQTREFEEEVGILIEDWKFFARISSESGDLNPWFVDFFAATVPSLDDWEPFYHDGELIQAYSLDNLPPVINNVPGLIFNALNIMNSDDWTFGETR